MPQVQSPGPSGGGAFCAGSFLCSPSPTSPKTILENKLQAVESICKFNKTKLFSIRIFVFKLLCDCLGVYGQPSIVYKQAVGFFY